MYDVIVVGGGIVGGSILRELSKYNGKFLLLEKENDVAEGASKANSAIVHSGYDPLPGTLMARLNVEGNAMFKKNCEDLCVDFKQNGSMVIGFSKDDDILIKELYERGIENKVPNIKILEADEVYKKEPNLSKGITTALYAPTGGIVGAYEYTIAIIENAVDNGAFIKRDSEVVGIEKEDNCFIVTTGNGDKYESTIVINCSGVNCADVRNMICKEVYTVNPARGEYYVLDKQEVITSTIFQCPTKEGKGILVTPSVHGNVLVGPNYDKGVKKDEVANTSKGLDEVRTKSQKTVQLDFRANVRNFAGLRCDLDGYKDFYIKEDDEVTNFIDVSGIRSPGLSAAPAIGVMVANMVKDKVDLSINTNFNPKRVKNIFIKLSNEEKDKLIKKDSNFGEIICRCENVTYGEIVESIRNSVGAVSIEGVKKRCRPGAGRCQGGFCQPKVLDILAKELGKDPNEIVYNKKDSFVLKKL